MLGDGGGKALTARNPIHGSDRITRFYLNVPGKVRDRLGTGQIFSLTPINGRPGLVGRTGRNIDMVVSLIVDQQGQIVRILHIANPDKLKRLNARAV